VPLRLPEPGPRRNLVLALLLFLAAAAFRLPGLGFPKDEYFDEVYHAKSARQYLEGEQPIEWVHPPLAKLLIATGVAAFGYESWAWRLVPALAGALLAPVFFFLARRALASERAALLATLVLLADGVYLVQSRIAMTNIFAVLFQCTAALCLLRAGLAQRLSLGAMSLLGLALGLAISTRWTSAFAVIFFGLVFLALRGKRILRPRELALVVLAFVVVPGVLYTASYLPLVMRGQLRVAGSEPNTLRSRADLARGARDLWQEQRNVFGYHANLKEPHPYFSAWWKWPWLVRPTWYFYEQKNDWVRGIVAIGNPALWWLSVPVTLYALWRGVRARNPRYLFAAMGFLCLYLPWGISPRTLNFGHYLFEAIPYACLSLGLILDELWDGPAGLVARSYLVLLWLLFFHFLPFLTAIPVPASWFFHRILGGPQPWSWFPTWI
jgi:dolichyl-phosphate-mannose-protein mannosyltransferase